MAQGVKLTKIYVLMRRFAMDCSTYLATLSKSCLKMPEKGNCKKVYLIYYLPWLPKQVPKNIREVNYNITRAEELFRLCTTTGIRKIKINNIIEELVCDGDLVGTLKMLARVTLKQKLNTIF